MRSRKGNEGEEDEIRVKTLVWEALGVLASRTGLGGWGGRVLP